MAKNICLDCLYFLVCKKASENIQDCYDYKFARKNIERKDSNAKNKK